MKTIRLNRKLTITALILSLIFHTSFMLYVALQKNSQLTNDTLQAKEEALKNEMKKDKEWAETKAQSGHFGAPVFFKDEPETDIIPPEPEAQQKETPTKEQETTSELKSETQTTPERAEQPEPTKMAPLYDKPTVARKLKNPQPQQAPCQYNKPVPPSIASAKSKTPTLAELTKGFLDQSKDSGTHLVHMLGKKNARPTDEQIKYERYLQRLSFCLQNSFNIHNHRFPSSQPIDTDAHIFLALNKEGTVKQLTLVKSSGSAQLDQFTLFIFKEASSSFPPVPQYLPHDPFSITYVVGLNTTQQSGLKLYRR